MKPQKRLTLRIRLIEDGSYLVQTIGIFAVKNVATAKTHKDLKLAIAEIMRSRLL